MHQKIVPTLALRALGLVAALSTVWLAPAQDSKGSAVAPVDRYSLPDRRAEVETSYHSFPAATSKLDVPGSSPVAQFVIPANTTVPLELRNIINSRTAWVGQPIYCITIHPVTISNRIVIPVGSYVRGHITRVVRPGRVKGTAQIGLRFDVITLPDGLTKPVRASLSGFAVAGNEEYNPREEMIRGEATKGKDFEAVAKSAGDWAGTGAFAGLSSGESLLGVTVGGSTGAMVRLIGVLASRGKDIVLLPGTSLDLSLESPLNYGEDEVEELSRRRGEVAHVPSSSGTKQ